MIYLLFIIAVIGWTGLFYYRDKAKEFESLFELSKGYETYTEITTEEDLPLNKWCKVTLVTDGRTKVQPLKFNKDGSIAKKRGRKPKA